MCHRVTCNTCHKPTWSGCGRHVDQALAGIAPAERCSCVKQAAPSGQHRFVRP